MRGKLDSALDSTPSQMTNWAAGCSPDHLIPAQNKICYIQFRGKGITLFAIMTAIAVLFPNYEPFPFKGALT